MNPYWIEDKALKKGEVDFLPQAEIKFWQELLEKYLYPIDEDKDEKVKQIYFFNHIQVLNKITKKKKIKT